MMIFYWAAWSEICHSFIWTGAVHSNWGYSPVHATWQARKLRRGGRKILYGDYWLNRVLAALVSWSVRSLCVVSTRIDSAYSIRARTRLIDIILDNTIIQTDKETRTGEPKSGERSVFSFQDLITSSPTLSLFRFFCVTIWMDRRVSGPSTVVLLCYTWPLSAYVTTIWKRTGRGATMVTSVVTRAHLIISTTWQLLLTLVLEYELDVSMARPLFTPAPFVCYVGSVISA